MNSFQKRAAADKRKPPITTKMTAEEYLRRQNARPPLEPVCEGFLLTGVGYCTLREVWEGRGLNKKGASLTDRTKAVQALIAKHPEITLALLTIGAQVAVGEIRATESQNKMRAAMNQPERAKHLHNKRSATVKRRQAEDSVALTKIAAFDRIVEMLDHQKVGDKMLGDCRKSDLLREAVRLDTISDEAKLRASFYRQLAKMIGDKTVRGAQDRGGIVALLTHTFQDA